MRDGSDLISRADLAKRLGRSPRWLQDFEPARRYGRMLGGRHVYTEEDYRRILEELPCPSRSSRRAKGGRPTGASAARISGSTLTEALRLASEGLPSNSCGAGKRKSKVASLSQHRQARSQPRH
jgi:hypothetical protein